MKSSRQADIVCEPQSLQIFLSWTPPWAPLQYSVTSKKSAQYILCNERPELLLKFWVKTILANNATLARTMELANDSMANKKYLDEFFSLKLYSEDISQNYIMLGANKIPTCRFCVRDCISELALPMSARILSHLLSSIPQHDLLVLNFHISFAFPSLQDPKALIHIYWFKITVLIKIPAWASTLVHSYYRLTERIDLYSYFPYGPILSPSQRTMLLDFCLLARPAIWRAVIERFWLYYNA